MNGGGLKQIVALGQKDVYLTSGPQFRRDTIFAFQHDGNLCVTCFITMSGRTYNNFEIIFHEEQLGKEYYSNDLINIYPINLSEINNNKSILVNSEKIIKINKEKLNSLIKRENKLKEEEEKERKKEERRNRNNVQFFKLSFRNANQVERAQRAAQNRQTKHQMRRR